MSLSVSPIKTANMLVLHGSDQINTHLPYLQDQKSLMLHWRSFQCIAYLQSAAIDNCIDNYVNLLDAFRAK